MEILHTTFFFGQFQSKLKYAIALKIPFLTVNKKSMEQKYARIRLNLKVGYKKIGWKSFIQQIFGQFWSKLKHAHLSENPFSHSNQNFKEQKYDRFRWNYQTLHSNNSFSFSF